jgi:crossover junction endodeoxyribonuclease RuvC
MEGYETMILYYIGIDPGMREAGIGVLDREGLFIQGNRLTNWSPHQFRDLMLDIIDLDGIDSSLNCLVAVEKVGSMPKQGIASTSKFMKATGIMIGVLVGLDIPFVEVAPQTWRKISPVLASAKGETAIEKKRKSLTYVQNRYPEAKLTKQVEHNVADALCIAEWLYINRGKKSDT